jgi:response regulator RpfG family c-di-GMP phosphodiesterase/DNA-binding CsgD family transcriptional regulator
VSQGVGPRGPAARGAPRPTGREDRVDRGVAEQAPGPLRLAELVAALSLATDLGTGQPLEHALRTCLLSLELARRSGVAADRLAEVYYLSLLRFVGCTADAAETAVVTGGDDMAFIGAMGPVFMGSPPEQVKALVRATGAGLPLPRRVARVAAALADPKGAERSITAHCEAAQLLSRRLGVGQVVTDTLGVAFERWDGKGIPGDAGEEDVPAAVRVVVVARDADMWARLGGAATAADVVRRRSGHAYDPSVAAAFADDPDGALAAVRSTDAWQAVLDAEPAPRVRIHEDRLPDVLAAVADFADLKSPWLRGHSRGVAALAATAAGAAGLGAGEGRALRLAGLVHDLGRVGVPNGVWDHPGDLTVEGWEKVRLHPYLTERILGRSARLAGLGRLASCHHERADGSGYHRGAEGVALSRPERLLAAADVYHALTEARPHRPAWSPDDACAQLRRAARTGSFASPDVEAVLEAAGHTPDGDVREAPAGLTEREVEVLRLIARGRSNREVAAELVVSPRTVGTHVEHIYAKAGVSTRAGAALFAMEHGLLTTPADGIG